MKKCDTCGDLKEEDDYAWRYKLRLIKWNTCMECQTAQRADWYQRNKEEHKCRAKENKKIAIKTAKDYVWNYLSTHPCIDCGDSDPHVLEFDHVRGKKRKTLSQLTGEGRAIAYRNRLKWNHGLSSAKMLEDNYVSSRGITRRALCCFRRPTG